MKAAIGVSGIMPAGVPRQVMLAEILQIHGVFETRVCFVELSLGMPLFSQSRLNPPELD